MAGGEAVKLSPVQRQAVAKALEMRDESQRLEAAAQALADNIAKIVCPHKVGDELIVNEEMKRRLYCRAGTHLRCVNVSADLNQTTVRWRASFAILNANGFEHKRRHSVWLTEEIK